MLFLAQLGLGGKEQSKQNYNIFHFPVPKKQLLKQTYFFEKNKQVAPI